MPTVSDKDWGSDAERLKVQNVRDRARAIGRELRRRWEPIVHQAVPEEWYDLLRAIDAKRPKAWR